MNTGGSSAGRGAVTRGIRCAVRASVGAWLLGWGLALAGGPAPVTTVDFQAVETPGETTSQGLRLGVWAGWSFPRGTSFGTPWGAEIDATPGDDRIRALGLQADAAIGADTHLGLAWQRGRQRSSAKLPPFDVRLDLEHEGWDLVGTRRLAWDAAEATWSVEAAVGRYRLTRAETSAGDTLSGHAHSVGWLLGLQAAWRLASPWEVVVGAQWRHLRFDVPLEFGAVPGGIGAGALAQRLDLGGPSVRIGLRWSLR